MRGPPLAPATATSLPLALCVTMMGDMADRGRLPGAMKFASEGCGVTSVFLQQQEIAAGGSSNWSNPGIEKQPKGDVPGRRLWAADSVGVHWVGWHGACKRCAGLTVDVPQKLLHATYQRHRMHTRSTQRCHMHEC